MLFGKKSEKGTPDPAAPLAEDAPVPAIPPATETPAGTEDATTIEWAKRGLTPFSPVAL